MARKSPPKRRRVRKTGSPSEPAFVERRSVDRRVNVPDQADRTLKLREFVFAYLRQLPEADLWLWIDGVLLGQATEPQLVALVTCVTESEAIRKRAGTGARPAGRPKLDRVVPGTDPIYNASLRAEWHQMTAELRPLSHARRQFHAPMNRNRSGRPRSTALRDAALRTLVGQRLEQLGLFAAFFDSQASTPQEMAAQWLRAELAAQCDDVEAMCRDRAANPLSDESRAWHLVKAEEAATRRTQLPTWQTLHKNLKRRLAPKTK